jgi:lysophospholipase L1-like esterase
VVSAVVLAVAGGSVAVAASGRGQAEAVAQAAVAVPAGRVLRVMPLGDSITVGLGDPRRNGWRPALKARLAEAGVRIDFVGSQRSGTSADAQHEGHGGWTVGQLAARAPGWVRVYRPDVVLVMAGTNDVSRRVRVGSAGVRLAGLVRAVRAARPGVRVIVASVPQMLVRDDRVALWSSYRAQVLRVVAQAGVGFAPGHRVYQRDLVAGDALHPSPCGYVKLAWVWFYGWTTTFEAPAGRVWDSGVFPPRCW